MPATLQNIGVFFVILHKLGTKKSSFLGKSHDEIFTLDTVVDMVLVVVVVVDMVVDMVLVVVVVVDMVVVVVVVDMVVEDHEELTRKGGVI